ncbi:MAG: YerC/YecD family TrpR-related protein [Fusobacteriaceae bacterium]
MDNTKYFSLTDALLQLKTEKEVKNFLSDLCTPAEIKSFNERWLIAQMHDEGGKTYREIQKETGASTTTIGRVARFLYDEKYKGYKIVLKRLKSFKNKNITRENFVKNFKIKKLKIKNF